jgi:CrcB protein
MSFIALWLAVGALGGAGALARFLLDRLVSARSGAHLPVGTLLVNLSGTAILGVLVGAALHGDAYLLAGTALIGSYTTFSAWMLESYALGQDGRIPLATLNVVLSVLLGLAAVALGRVLGGG